MKNFEQKEKYRAKKTEFKETVSKKDEMIRNISHQIEDMTLLINSLKTQVQIFSKENTELTTLIQSKNKELQEFQANFHKVNTTYKEKTSSLENKIKQKISLDDAGYEYLTSYNAPKFNYQYNQKQNE